jgi:hypothetical protein
MAWTMVGVGVIAVVALGAGIAIVREASRKHMGMWLGPYLKQRWPHAGVRKRTAGLGPRHILFCMVDHFEPIYAGSTKEQEREIMRDWLQRYPALARRHRDSDGKPPHHTWF